MRTAGLARSSWKKDEVPLLHEVIAESTRRAMGWPDSKNGNTVLTSFFGREEERTSKTVPQSDNAAENNESARPVRNTQT